MEALFRFISGAAAISRVENGSAADPDEIRRGWELFVD